MKIAYLILAHTNPRLIRKAVDCLSRDDVTFFIHIDGKADLARFSALRGNNVVFVQDRITVYWGEYSQTRAILLLIQQALLSPAAFDYFVLLSGSDFPLRSGHYIHAFFERNRGSEFITLFKLPVPGMPLSRLNTIRFPSTRPVLRFIYRVLAKVGLGKRDYRKHLGALEPYSGHTWWALSRECCEYILDSTRQRPELGKFFQNTFASDEMLIHTVLANSPFSNRVKRHLVYEDWPVEGPRRHPKMITAEHLDRFEAQEEVAATDVHGPGEMLFARKFADDKLYLVERVEAMIRRKDASETLNSFDAAPTRSSPRSAR